MMTATYTAEMDKELEAWKGNSDEDVSKEEFIGPDGEKHHYVYNDEDYHWHSGMTNEEWLPLNNPKQYECCLKCSNWENCRKGEHTILTKQSALNKATAEFAKKINKDILAEMEKSGLLEGYKKKGE